MGIKVVNPDDPSIEPVGRKLPVLPREEAHRIRRASRQAFDQYLPRALEIVAEMAMSEDSEDRKWAFEKIAKYTLAGKSNEELDPETAVVNGSVTSKNDLAALEEMTKDGTGSIDPEDAQ